MIQDDLPAVNSPMQPLMSLLSGVFDRINKLDTADIILLLILFLLYKETGDEEYLIILLVTLIL